MVSSQGKTLAAAIVAGLGIGAAGAFIQVYGVPLYVILIQENWAVSQGAYWQLFTSLIVATPDIGGVADVMFNALAVVWLDGMIAGQLTPREYYATFVLSGLAGNLASMLDGPSVSSFGASGGIFGLLACAVVADYAAEGRANTGLIAWFLLVFLISSFALPNVDWLAHLGGTFFGAAAGWYLGAGRRGAQL